jgi:hypothetical protein
VTVAGPAVKVGASFTGAASQPFTCQRVKSQSTPQQHAPLSCLQA